MGSSLNSTTEEITIVIVWIFSFFFYVPACHFVSNQPDMMTGDFCSLLMNDEG